MLQIEGFSGVVTVTRDGQPITTVTAGGCTPATPFQIASVSKNFASTLTMMLVEDGVLALHTPLRHWLPEAPWPSVTLHHVLSNSSGIGHWADVPGMDPSAPATRDERLKLVLAAPLLFEPGSEFRYSSPAFMLVGAVAERATGTGYGDLLAEKIFRPLGLSRTTSGFRLPDTVPGHRAGEPVEPWDLRSMIGSGDLCSTAEDLLAYARGLEGGALVSQDSLALMRTPHTRFPEPDRSPDGRLEVTGYGYGHYLGTFDGKRAALHTGDNPGYRSLVGWLPDGVVIVGLSNDDSIQWEDVLARVL
jgi:CubicO group peptidase (beta-lactamase class C family)